MEISGIILLLLEEAIKSALCGLKKKPQQCKRIHQNNYDPCIWPVLSLSNCAVMSTCISLRTLNKTVHCHPLYTDSKRQIVPSCSYLSHAFLHFLKKHLTDVKFAFRPQSCVEPAVMALSKHDVKIS